MKSMFITEFQVVENHPYLKAIANVKWNGLHLRGLRLVEGHGKLGLGFPGRKIQGQWQVVYETSDRSAKNRLLQQLTDHYRAQVAA